MSGSQNTRTSAIGCIDLCTHIHTHDVKLLSIVLTFISGVKSMVNGTTW